MGRSGSILAAGELSAVVCLFVAIGCLMFAHQSILHTATALDASLRVLVHAVDVNAVIGSFHQPQQQSDQASNVNLKNTKSNTGHPKGESFYDNEQTPFHAFRKARDSFTDHISNMDEMLAMENSENAELARCAMAGRYWDSDDICLHSHKVLPSCKSNGELPLLVTGVGRSGTHHMASSLRHRGFDICHEAVCSLGSISWTYAVVDPNAFYPWELARNRIKGRRFHQIFHLVRHPLRCIASLTTYETLSWRFIEKHTPQVPNLASIQPVLRRALVHWVTWNRMVEVYADRRFRTEDTTPKTLCLAAGFEIEQCEKQIKRLSNKAKRSHPEVTWEELYSVDKEFTQAAMRLAHKYGYDDIRKESTVWDNDDDVAL
eukprot:gene4737-8653_t